MNLILLRAEELRDEARRATLRGRRHQHIRGVLKAQPGDILQVGRLGGPEPSIGRAEVLAIDGQTVELALEWMGSPPPPPPVELIIALPRPQTLKKLLLELTSLGLERLRFVRAERTEKSYLQSKLLQDERYREHLELGLEQARDTQLPGFEVHPRLRDLLAALPPASGSEAGMRLVAHPSADAPPLSHQRPGAGRVLLAIGPEGGWRTREVEAFREAGFLEVQLGPRILRVETAAALALAQLAALRDLGAAPP